MRNNDKIQPKEEANGSNAHKEEASIPSKKTDAPQEETKQSPNRSEGHSESQDKNSSDAKDTGQDLQAYG